MLRIALLGDIGLIGNFSAEKNGYIATNTFSEVKDVLSNADIVIGNLESPLTNARKKHGAKSVHIKSNPESIRTLEYLGVDYLNLANNHMYDYGKQGIDETIKILKESGIGYFGYNEEKIYVEKNGARFSLNGYCCFSTNPQGVGNNKINPLNPTKIEVELKDDKNKGFLSILSMHFGEEHVAYPNYDHIQMARKLTNISKYVLYGHHPHVLQGIEEYEDSLLIYSLGNFCFDHDYTASLRSLSTTNTKPENLRTAIVFIDIKGNEVIKREVIPFQVVNGVLKRDKSGAILNNLEQWSKGLADESEFYIERRNKELIKVRNEQIKKRDLLWYKKRMNIRSIKLLVNNYRNKQRYYKTVRNYIE